MNGEHKPRLPFDCISGRMRRSGPMSFTHAHLHLMHFTRASLRNADYQCRKKRRKSAVTPAPASKFTSPISPSSSRFVPLVLPDLAQSDAVSFNPSVWTTSFFFKKILTMVHKCFWWSWVRICVGGWAVTPPRSSEYNVLSCRCYYRRDTVSLKAQVGGHALWYA